MLEWIKGILGVSEAAGKVINVASAAAVIVPALLWLQHHGNETWTVFTVTYNHALVGAAAAVFVVKIVHWSK